MSDALTVSRYTTDDLPARDRVSMWRESVNHMLKCDVAPTGEAGLRWNAAHCMLPGVTVVNVTSTPYELARNRSQAADGDDDFVLSYVRGSAFVSRQLGRETFVSAGEAVLWSNEHAGSTQHLPGAALQVVAIPRRLLAPLVPQLDSLVTSLVSRETASLKLLSFYLSTLYDDTVVLSPELKALSASHIHDLVALTLGTTRDATEIAKGRGVRVARLKAIKADIDTHLVDRDLSLETLARRHNISPRYIRALFDGEGTSFTGHVLNMRLARAYGALANPAQRQVKVSTIAFESGFGDLSHFNYAFRRHFGLTPSDARALASAGPNPARNA